MSLSITSFSFVIFATLVIVLYYIIPKHKWIVLCIASYFYYGYVSNWHIGPMVISAATLWLGSLYLDKTNRNIKILKKGAPERKKYKRKSRIILLIIIGVNLGLLLFYKFVPNTMFPLAISFYTLSGIGYIVDVYKGGEAEGNICKFSLLLCFFPIMTQGPIVRYKKLRTSLYRDNCFNINNVVSGLILALGGGIKKLVIADRVCPLVNGVFNDYETYSGLIIPIAVIGYMIQLYCDFSGGIDIIIGYGKMLGIDLPENFRQPYFSESVSEFWRRWHISLGNWFKDYIYMPLAMSRLNNKIYGKLKSKYGVMVAKTVTTSAVTFVVWIVNGIWHGAGWKYVVFGAYMGILISIDNFRKNKEKEEGIQEKIIHFVRILRTLFLMAIGWMLIRVNNLSDFPKMIGAIFAANNKSVGLIANIKVFWGDMDCAVLAYSVASLFFVELLQRKKSIRARISEAKPITVIAFWLVLIFTWLVLSYDSGNEVRGFIYANF